jgi:hypothetical protein
MWDRPKRFLSLANQASSGGQFCGSNISRDSRLVNLSGSEYGPCHTDQLVGQRNESNVVMFMQREFSSHWLGIFRMAVALAAAGGAPLMRFADDDWHLWAAFGVDILSRGQVRDVLVDLKRRIQGDFFVIEEDEGKIVLGNRVCPFEDKVLGRRSMCMMTSNVFGSIAAENLGYAKVELQQTIASGDGDAVS